MLIERVRTATLIRVTACAWILVCGSTGADELVPLEVGNRWVYIHEVFDGQHIGSYSIDTCAVEIGSESIAVFDGVRYFAQGVGGTCRSSAEAIYRNDEQGRIIRRVDDNAAGPDTSAFLDDNPEFADRFRDQIASWSLQEGEIVFIDTAFRASSFEPFTRAYIDWYGRYVDSLLGYHAVRLGQEDSEDWPWRNEFAMPGRFRSGSARVAVTYSSNLIATEGGTISVFETGVGLVAEYGYSVISPGRSLSSLIWARVNGVEYGDRPTAVEHGSWGRLKTVRAGPSQGRRTGWLDR